MRTIIKSLSISPELEKEICCPTCFSLYKLSDAPWLCSYKKSKQARPCGEKLFETKGLYQGICDKGKSQKYPSLLKNLLPSEIGHLRNIYVTQRLSSWLSWFLSKSTIEDKIHNWSKELSQSTMNKIHDIQQSPAWKEMTWPDSPSTGPAPLDLLVSLFINWFNPQSNRKRGAQQSFGVLSFNCLNLPPSLRNLIQNTCVAGITPGPNGPDMMTISHILKAVVDDLLLLEHGDVVGMRKVAGYASHSAILYCSWCWAKSTNTNRIQIKKLRTKDEVIGAANRSKAAVSLHQKDIILKETGVHWLEFTQLTYRNLVTHLPLGIMHNWFEGVLHHHFRFYWGFVIYTNEVKANMKRKRRGIEAENQGGHLRKQIVYEEGGGNALDEEDSDLDKESESCDFEPNIKLKTGWDSGLFLKEDIVFFRERLRDVVLPTSISRLPFNLGDSNHGTLKAAQWHSLFAYIILLIILKLYISNVDQLQRDSNRGQILLNIGCLCQCTNIVCAKKAGEYEAHQFENFYGRYHETSKRIFQKPTIKPNHHYALHIPNQIRFWGPLNSVAEFSGERLIGVLQKIKTNSHLGKCFPDYLTCWSC
ncbi:hypothetical protein CROQUDRAFT_99490 [Cronartium quercuum f. sp. fusiforme G11]|uniref:Uncharacterized protein n=1 Tax=Cronartium quercuum f. sp. fusiforme G11 TaxID=708437 RepID=A0A9P6N8C1_9BASI|nr:hypothetical protein CROQUDRAFT_99490 [Cronartium quercuum f. sp. fusiforme G11]